MLTSIWGSTLEQILHQLATKFKMTIVEVAFWLSCFIRTLTSSDDLATKIFSFNDSGKESNLWPTEDLILFSNGFVIGSGMDVNDELLELVDWMEDLGVAVEAEELEVTLRQGPSLQGIL